VIHLLRRDFESAWQDYQGSYSCPRVQQPSIPS
jgi:hypothetical protein